MNYIVYYILNTKTYQFYIGSTNGDGIKRFKEHQALLRNNKHHNKKLQLAWDKDGSSCFWFGVLEFIDDIELLLLHEQKWIDYFWDTGILYNHSRYAGYKKKNKCCPKQIEMIKELCKIIEKN